MIVYRTVQKQSFQRPFFILCHFIRRIARETHMDTVNDHIHTLLDGNPSSSALDSIHDSLADGLFSELREQAWFPQQAEEWGKRVAGESALQISTRIRELKDRHLDSATIRRIMADFSQNPISAIFLTPEAVRTIYSDSPPEFGALIQEGADYHCRIIRRAVSQAVRRHIAGMKRASLDVRELEEELVGMVMEETVRCLSDLSARVWKKNNPVPVVFPSEGARGMRHGILTRVALSKDGGRLAAVRSDRCLFVWDIGNRELLHTWDISLLDDLGKTDTLESLFFSTDGWRIALETVNRQVVTLNLNDETASIHGYRETDREAFYKEFGSPFIPRRTAIPENGFLIQTRLGKSVSLSQYSGCVFDWACDSRFQTVAAASERERAMPEWMRKAGFERAVYHIAQRRLIDLIRKRTHTQYACWRCGSMISSFSDTQCRFHPMPDRLQKRRTARPGQSLAMSAVWNDHPGGGIGPSG